MGARPRVRAVNRPGSGRANTRGCSMMTKWAPITALVLTGCGQPDVDACERFVKGELRSPSTYRQVALTQRDLPLSLKDFRAITGDRSEPLRDMIDKRSQNGIRTITITYDASNAYGTSVRETRECHFRLRDGKLLGDAQSFDLREKKQKLDRDFWDAARSGVIPNFNPADVPPEPERSCCL